MKLKSHIAIVGAAFLLVGGCKPVSNSGASTWRTSEPSGKTESPVVLSLSNGVSCLVSENNRAVAAAILADSAKSLSAKDILADAFVKKTLDADVQNTQHATKMVLCDAAIEKWALQSFALKKHAPYDVASLNIPYLAELKLLLAGGGIAAGLMGDGIGAACMSGISAGLSYGETKGWVTCR